MIDPDLAAVTARSIAESTLGAPSGPLERVTSLLDFEWARFGKPSDDWMFLARFSGPHLHAVLAEIADVTGTPLDALRAACEVREAAHLVADLRLALAGEVDKAPTRLVQLPDDIVTGRLWWAS